MHIDMHIKKTRTLSISWPTSHPKKDKAGPRNHQAMCVFCLLMCLPFKLSSQNFKKLGMKIVPFEDTQIPFRRDKLSTFSDQNVTDTRMSELLASLVSLTVGS
jgi:hypothetical protein